MGRPRNYTDTAVMIKDIEEYFESCLPQPLLNPKTDKPYLDKNNNVIMHQGDKLTITGLALALGFNSRQGLYDSIARNDDFSVIIKNAMTYVENGYEKLVQGNSPTGAIFVLKNMKWKDKTEVEASGGQELKIVREIVKHDD